MYHLLARQLPLALYVQPRLGSLTLSVLSRLTNLHATVGGNSVQQQEASMLVIADGKLPQPGPDPCLAYGSERGMRNMSKCGTVGAECLLERWVSGRAVASL